VRILKKANQLSPWIQVRASEDEKKLAMELAERYDTDVSTLVKALMQYAEKNQPALAFTKTLGKGEAVASHAMALN
jgi:prolyl-tRNA editing enzyme YbaK/EbsC (Cys-tRNA(Pro) deacylase)